jgi:hypothetical protein
MGDNEIYSKIGRRFLGRQQNRTILDEINRPIDNLSVIVI